LVALEGDGPNHPPGKPLSLGLLVAGRDGIAVDIVCAKIMGINPKEVKHLMLSQKKGLGITKDDIIEIKGETLNDVITEFERPSTFKKNRINYAN
jgi:uncharacterized protein (DUF362 family)